MSTRLPSLNALRAFEATARHRSMTRAAQELCVTHGAVSRQIKSLEAVLHLTLLTRGAGSLEPTPEGTRLAEGLTTAFGLMQVTLDNLRPGPLILSCSSSIAMCWLIPRMPSFYRCNPGIEIKLDMNYDRVDFGRHNISVAIRNSTIEPPRGAVIRDLGVEWIGPVCSPEYCRATRLIDPPDLSNARILSTNTRPHAWQDWLSASGNIRIDVGPQQSFEHFYLMTQAAASGLGVAVLPHMLAINDLAAGRLVAPFGFVPGPRQLFLWLAPQMADRRDVKELERWLVEELLRAVPNA